MPGHSPATVSIRRRLARAAVAAGCILVGSWMIGLGAVLVRGRIDQARPADAIVVLGAAQYQGKPSPVLKARLDHGIALYKKGLAPRLILTGGRGVGDTTTEAAVGRRYAMRRGVPARAILVEDVGRTTDESLEGVAALMNVAGVHRAVLVSDPFHMLRLDILARRHGIAAWTSPTRTSPIEANPGQAWEYVLAESMKVPAALVLTEMGSKPEPSRREQRPTRAAPGAGQPTLSGEARTR
jgi:uncharacterized SAM-binding protein YcdF (DUF218 family)